MASQTILAAAPDLDTRKHLVGLTGADVEDRRARGAVNTVKPQSSRSYRRILFENAITFVNVLLYVIVGFLLALGLYGDAFMTAILVVANVVIGSFQEARAKRKLDKIALLTRPVATVLRDGVERQIEPGEIVVDDLLLVGPGDQVLVDGSIVLSTSVTMDESLLTGESDLVPKNVGDQVYSGSFCMTGGGIYRAEKVGAASMAQRITEQARAHRAAKTPLQREVTLAIRIMLFLMLLLGVQVADTFRQIYTHVPMTESVRAAAVIVALIPQGLIFMVTVSYAMAAVRMSGKGALIQRMNAVESTSQVNILCLDKTGTLTTNELQVREFAPIGLDEPALRRALGDFAASASSGNRTSNAIRTACPSEGRPVLAETPFSSDRKWSSVAFDDGVWVLGAPEMLLPALVDGAEIASRVSAWADQGYRVLLFAHAATGATLPDPAGSPELPAGLEPVGLISISDELRPEARSTIAEFAAEGIALKIISGDNPTTVAALAKQAGMPGDLAACSGLDLDGISDSDLDELAQRTTVFGRVSPQQKERIIRALRRGGDHVAMIGDGVNDVLALKQANLAISVRSGSQVARSVADIVLLDDSFAALPAAFREGQRILKGMQDIIRLFLIRALYTSLLIFGATQLRVEFPTTPKQSGLIAMLTVGIPVLFLALWAKPGVTPRRLIPSSGYFVVPAGVSIAIAGLTIYAAILSLGGKPEEARTAITVTSIACGLLLLPFLSPPSPAWVGGDELTGDRRPALLAGAILVLFVAGMFVGPLRDFYELIHLPLSIYVLIGFVVIGWASLLRFVWRLQLLPRSVAAVSRWIASIRGWFRRVFRREEPAATGSSN
ncbi:MAG TPA: HAD-IC family P-type ATPase [Thermomicrobiales bacterium]|nr:HAD-IC family P-type ATPase [Thermomicrobiales bacterium]HRA32824.1 HAD-IC family P-type ATPase [Thermomicrobiales bacterium]